MKKKPEINKRVLAKINRLERQLLVNSCIYYLYNKNLIDDSHYDNWSFNLNEMIHENPDEFKKSEFYKDFTDFDPSSGYYLNYQQPKIKGVAYYLLKLHHQL